MMNLEEEIAVLKERVSELGARLGVHTAVTSPLKEKERYDADMASIREQLAELSRHVQSLNDRAVHLASAETQEKHLRLVHQLLESHAAHGERLKALEGKK